MFGSDAFSASSSSSFTSSANTPSAARPPLSRPTPRRQSRTPTHILSRRPIRRLTPVIFGLFLAACTGRETRDAGDPSRSLIRVQVSYTHTSGTPAADLRYEAQAQFVRYRALDPAGVSTLLG